MQADQLSLFVRVAQRGGFAALAREEGLDPSMVSRQIAALERELGFRLFHRSTRKVSLTSAGAIYLRQVAPLLEELEQARECALTQNQRAQGRLVLTASTAFGQSCILPHVGEFRSRYPEVQLDLRFTDAVVDILADQVDLACRLTSNADPNLVGKKLFSIGFWVCASPAYLKCHGTPEEPQALLGAHRMLAMNLPSHRDRWWFKAPGDDSLVKIPLRSDILVSNALAMRELALQGAGLALLANWLVAEDIARGRLVRLFVGYQVSATDFQSAAWLLYPSRRFIPAKTRAMVDFLKEKFASENPWSESSGFLAGG